MLSFLLVAPGAGAMVVDVTQPANTRCQQATSFTEKDVALCSPISCAEKNATRPLACRDER